MESTGVKAEKANERNQYLRYVARQPILSANESVYGYELLFRDGVEDCFRSGDSDAASRSTLDASILMGLDVLCDGRRAFINCTRDILLKDYITLLPPAQATIEILETIEPDDLVVAACKRMRAAGYLIALDDFTANDPRESLADLADIIKVDMRSTSLEERAAIVKRLGSKNCRMLAEKVETREEFVAAKQAGFVLFQGYFFRRPETMHAREIPANQVNYLRLLQAICRPQLDTRELENIIKGEASLCYRLLRYLNSPIFGLASEIHSIRHALAMLGEREIRRWIRLAATLVACQNKSSDLVLSALVRARFCEVLAPKIKHGNSDPFLLGLLSLMDVILEVPIGMVLDGISVDHETRDVLLGKENSLTPFYQLMVAQEKADWDTVTLIAGRLHIPETLIAECRWEAMQWARQMTAGAPAQ